ncbi:T9SS type B sorting domain-containing protein [Maribacter sp. 2210JD10-5]|uniref:T9SS type B sorting domain-containing protein n=1 Tax=Maribacter sp. 2210JD10-5 TaxID=3386272 RepID=UPI0039BC8FDA
MKKQLELLRLSTYFLVFFVFFMGNAQLEGTNWYFGQNAGINFGDGTTALPFTLSDGVLVTDEGCSSVSDKNGNLLFYSDGVNVYNRAHYRMPNGDNLKGSDTSTQSAVIVPHPSDHRLYFIFTVGKSDNIDTKDGLNYSVVDMDLDNGHGDVVANKKNIQLLSNTTEKLSAIVHPTRNSFWLVTMTNDKTFHAFELAEDGSIKPAIKSGFPGFIRDGRGSLKISPNGNYIATANYSDESAYLYRFDSNTGSVDLEQRINGGDNFFPYGVEFSQDSKFLYLTTYSANDDETYLLQYRTANQGINNSKEIIAIDDFFRGSLQLGIDGKIYRAKPESDYLGVIANPHLPGLLCNYNSEAVVLGGGISKEGLPSFIQSSFTSDIQINTNCLNQATTFSINTNLDIQSISWNFGDPSSNTNNFSTELRPSHSYPDFGLYEVNANVTFNDGRTVRFVKEVEIYELPLIDTIEEIQLCYANISEVELFLNEQTPAILGAQDASIFSVSYHASLVDAETNRNPLSFLFKPSTNLETIFVRVDNTESQNCYTTGSFDIILEKVDPIAIEDSVYLCENGTVEVNAYQDSGVSYLWTNGATSSSIELQDLGNYSVTVSFESGCSLTKSFEVVAQPLWRISEIETSEDMATIRMVGNESFLFSIDGFTFQESNTFNNLLPGIYTAYITDSNRCTILTKQFSIFGLPKFFTPNNDGVNDIWDISSLTFIPDSEVYIFDKFGTLLAQLNPLNNKGWNGTFAGKLLPPSDYWYKVVRVNAPDYKGHFTLKR